MQLVFYRWCLDRWRDRHTWIAFIDADEFLYTPGPETFPEILASFEGNDTVGALGVSVHLPFSLPPSTCRLELTDAVASTHLQRPP
jgi:glycosyl transferase family 92